MKRKFLVFFLLGIVMHQFVSAQGEIQRMKIEREAAREKAREEAKAQNLPAPAILDIDLVRPTHLIEERQKHK